MRRLFFVAVGDNLDQMENVFICPDCKKSLSLKKETAFCTRCETTFYLKKGVWRLLPKGLEKNKVNEDKLHLIPECDVFKYNDQVWRCLIDLAPHLTRFEKEIVPKMKGRKKILELACGNGWAIGLAKLANPQAETYATDVSPNVLEMKTRKLCQMMGAKIDAYVAADAENLPFKNSSIDFIFVIASLHHFADIPKVLKEIGRVLRQGGCFIGIDGAIPVWYQRLVFGGKAMERSRKFGVLEKLLTYRQWQELIKSGGFPKSSLTPYTNPGYAQSVNNVDEAKINRFQFLKEIVFKAIVPRLPAVFIKFFCEVDLLPVGIVINFVKE